MGLANRIALVAKSWVHALLAPATDPREAFAPAHQRQRELLSRVRIALRAINESRIRLEARSARVNKNMVLLEDRARQSLASGREDLARYALQRRQVGLSEIRSLAEHLGEVGSEEGRLSVVEQRLLTQIEVFRARLEVISARYSAAEAQVQINEAFAGVSDELADLGSVLERAELRSEDMEARASALDRLIGEGALETPSVASSSIGELSFGEPYVLQPVEKQLAAMKRDLEREEGV